MPFAPSPVLAVVGVDVEARVVDGLGRRRVVGDVRGGRWPRWWLPVSGDLHPTVPVPAMFAAAGKVMRFPPFVIAVQAEALPLSNPSAKISVRRDDGDRHRDRRAPVAERVARANRDRPVPGSPAQGDEVDRRARSSTSPSADDDRVAVAGPGVGAREPLGRRSRSEVVAASVAAVRVNVTLFVAMALVGFGLADEPADGRARLVDRRGVVEPWRPSCPRRPCRAGGSCGCPPAAPSPWRAGCPPAGSRMPLLKVAVGRHQREARCRRRRACR